jgi:hypothetical protein
MNQPQYQQPQYYAPQAPAAPQAQFQQPQFQPQYAPQPQFAQPVQQAAAPEPVLARGTLEDFWDQPSVTGGGAGVTKYFNGKVQGSWLDMVVSRDLLHSDTRQQTDINGIPQAYKDGRPKFVLIVPVTITGSSDGTHGSIFTDGAGTIWVKGALKDEFARAMAAAGIRDLTGGTRIIMMSAGEKASNRPGFSATKLYQVTLYPPQGGTPAQVQVEVPVAAPQAAPLPTAPPVAAAPAPVPSAPVAPQTFAPAPPVPVASAPFAPGPDSNLTEAQQLMLAKLNGGQ